MLNCRTSRLPDSAEFASGRYAMVNPTFLDVNNSISSGQVAELKMGYGGQGVVDETTKPGFVSRLLNYIWPF